VTEKTLPIDRSNSVRRNFSQHKLFNLLPLHSKRQQTMNGIERQWTFPESLTHTTQHYSKHFHKNDCIQELQTDSHNHFTALWTLTRLTQVSWYQKVHYAIFWIFWCKMKITQADKPTIRMDCHYIQTNLVPHLCNPTIFTPDVLPGTSLPVYPGFGQALNMLACIPGGCRQTSVENV